MERKVETIGRKIFIASCNVSCNESFSGPYYIDTHKRADLIKYYRSNTSKFTSNDFTQFSSVLTEICSNNALYTFAEHVNGNEITSKNADPAFSFVIPAHAGKLPACEGMLPLYSGVMPKHAGKLPACMGMIPAFAGTPPECNGIVPAYSGIAPACKGSLPARAGIADEDTGLNYTITKIKINYN